MALPGIVISIQDGNLQLVQGNATDVCIKLGVCTKGVPNVLQAFGSQSAMVSALGTGSLVDNLSYEFSASGGPVICMPLLPDSPGSLSAVTTNSTGGALVINTAPDKQVQLKIVHTGDRGVGQFIYQIGTDGYSAPIVIPNTGVYNLVGVYGQVEFPSGTYVNGDGIQFNTDGTISGHGSTVPTLQAQPVDSFTANVIITKSGTPGTAQGVYSLDGYSYSAPFILPMSANFTFAVNGTINSGIFGTFTGTFSVDDRFNFSSCGPTFNANSLDDAFVALNTVYLDTAYSLSHIVQGGSLTSAANAEIQALSCSEQANGLALQNIFTRTICECPSIGSVFTSVDGYFTIDSADNTAAIESAFINFESDRVVVCPDDELIVSNLYGLVMRRNIAWGVSARLTAIPPAQDAGWVGAPQGSIPGVFALARDEFQTPGLDQARFTTMRTFTSSPGFYVTNAKTMSTLTSDYQFLTNARVIDEVATLAAEWATPYINSQVPINTAKNASPGSILPSYAATLDASLTGFLNSNLVNTTPQACSAVNGQVDRTNNIISTGKLIFTITVVPFGYAREIDITIGFTL